MDTTKDIVRVSEDLLVYAIASRERRVMEASKTFLKQVAKLRGLRAKMDSTYSQDAVDEQKAVVEDLAIKLEALLAEEVPMCKEHTVFRRHCDDVINDVVNICFEVRAQEEDECIRDQWLSLYAVACNVANELQSYNITEEAKKLINFLEGAVAEYKASVA